MLLKVAQGNRFSSASTLTESSINARELSDHGLSCRLCALPALTVGSARRFEGNIPPRRGRRVALRREPDPGSTHNSAAHSEAASGGGPWRPGFSVIVFFSTL